MEPRRPAWPYPPSRVDRLADAIARLPGPWWVVYLIAFAVLLIGANAAAWIDGTRTPGAFDLYLSALAVYAVAPLAAIYYLDIKASDALEEMRPALAVDEPSLQLLRYRLTTMPGRR